MFSDVHGLGFCRVRAVVGGRIEALFTGFQQAAFIAAIDAFFLAADRIGTFPVRGNRSESAGVIRRSAGSAPFAQETVVAGKPAAGNGINALSGQLTQPVLDALHSFDVHDPVPAEGHPDQSLHILSAPVFDQPGGVFGIADTTGAFQLFDHVLPEFALQIRIFQTGQHPFRGPHHFLCIPVQFSDIQLPGKFRDFIAG